MKKEFKKEDGVTKTPYPIYPNEIRDEKSSLGAFKTKTTEQNSSEVEKAAEYFSSPFIASGVAKSAFIAGAEWQQSQQVSKEEELNHWKKLYAQLFEEHFKIPFS